MSSTQLEMEGGLVEGHASYTCDQSSFTFTLSPGYNLAERAAAFDAIKTDGVRALRAHSTRVGRRRAYRVG